MSIQDVCTDLLLSFSKFECPEKSLFLIFKSIMTLDLLKNERSSLLARKRTNDTFLTLVLILSAMFQYLCAVHASPIGHLHAE